MAIGRPDPNKSYTKLLDAAKQARMPFDRTAWLNLAFYLNEQYCEWHDDTGSIRRIPRPKNAHNTPRPVVNKIMQYIQQEQAMVLQARPTADVLPATDDLLDMSNAAVSKAYCEWVADPTNANFDKQLKRAVLWALLTPSGYLKWVWNPRLNRPDIIPCSFFEIYPDPYAKEFGRCRYIFHSQFMDVEQVYEAWGKEVQPGKVEQVDPMRTELLRGMGSSPVLSGVTVNELWMKPCRRYPDGLYVVWTGKDRLVEPGPLPYDHKRLPFTQLGSIERPDSLFYASPVEYLRSAQMELNKFHAQRIMIRESFANPKWWVPAELELEEMPSDAPRQILRGQSQMGMLRPEIIQPSAFPGPDDGAMIEQQMMNIVGLHEVSQAQVPGRVEAAKAIEILKESDADRQASLLDSIKAAIAEGYYQVLMLAKQYAPADTIVQTYSREGLPEVKRFKAEQIKPGMRISVTMGTGLARSRAARQDQLMVLWQNQVIRDPELMAELMEVPFPSFVAPKALDMKLARNENLEMAKGVAIVPNSWDDHNIHLREHNNYRKTQEFLTAQVDVKQKFEMHAQTHQEMLSKEIQAQMALQQAIGGGQGNGGPQPQPPSPPAPDTATPEPAGDTVGA